MLLAVKSRIIVLGIVFGLMLHLSMAVKTPAELYLKKRQNITDNEIRSNGIHDGLLMNEGNIGDEIQNHLQLKSNLDFDKDKLGEIINNCRESTVEDLTAEHWRLLMEEMDDMNCGLVKTDRLFNQVFRELNLKDGFNYDYNTVGAGYGFRARCRLLGKFESCIRKFNHWLKDKKYNHRMYWPQAVVDAINFDNLDFGYKKK